MCLPVVRAQAWRTLQGGSDVDDVVQEVWERLIRSAGQIHSPLYLIGWLTIVTRRVALEVIRRRDHLVLSDTVETLRSAESSESAEDAAIRSWLRVEAAVTVEAMLAGLPERDREFMMMLHREDKPHYDEISRVMGRPMGSIGPTRQRLLRRMRTCSAARSVA